MSRSGATVLAIALLLVAPSAWAVTFDFAAAVAASGEGGHSSFSMTVGGLTVTATATTVGMGAPPVPLGLSGPIGVDPVALSPPNPAWVYLDGPNEDSLVAGLGVCKTLGTVGGVAVQCDPSGDDDVSSGETLRLEFSSSVILTGITFRNASHGTSFTGQFFLSNGGWSESPLLSHNFTPSPTWSGGTAFYFSHESENYYIQSLEVEPVPEPTTLGLLGAGLLLGGRRIRRRRR